MRKARTSQGRPYPLTLSPSQGMSHCLTLSWPHHLTENALCNWLKANFSNGLLSLWSTSSLDGVNGKTNDLPVSSEKILCR